MIFSYFFQKEILREQLGKTTTTTAKEEISQRKITVDIKR